MKELLNKFLKFEKDNDLLNKEIDGIYFWEFIRRRVSDNIMKDLNLIDSSEYTIGNNKKEKIYFALKYLWNALKNIFKPIPKVKRIIINHPRKILINNEYIDVYTYYLQEKYKNSDESFLTIDVPLNWHKHLIRKEKYIRNMENFSILKKIYYKFYAKNKYNKNPLLQEISCKLKKEFGSDGDLFNIANSQINIYKADYKYFTKLFKKAKPSVVEIVISEVYPGIVSAAKDLKIETVEIQHAAISKIHLAYEYPYNKKIHYFPDKIRIFGEFWYDSVNMPIKKENVILTENKYLSLKCAQKNNKIKNQILFVTQGWITNSMIDLLEDFLKLTKSYKIVVKLHPSEYEVWDNIYPKLKALKKKYKLQVVDNFDKDIYEWMKESPYVVGVSSTCLYEALFFECKVHILNLPSAESMEELINKKIVTLSNNAKELLDNINKNNDLKIDLNYFYYKEENNEGV